LSNSVNRKRAAWTGPALARTVGEGLSGRR
jgi:hypothetical protein